MALVSLQSAWQPTDPGPQSLPVRRPPLTHQSGALPDVRPGDLLPYGYRVKGTNLIPSLAQETAAGGGIGLIWSYIWTNWDIGWLRSCLDNAVALGCNTVRFLSTVGGIYFGEITRAQVLSRWSELSEECQARGLYLYPSGMDITLGDRFESVPYAAVKAEIVAWAAHMHTLPDVIGLDLVTESGGAWASGANALDLYAAVKAVTDLSCTFSGTEQPDGTTAAPSRFADRADHLDFHTYNYTPGNTIFDAYWSGGGTRPILIGEFGLPQAQGATAVNSYYQANRRLAERVTPTGQRAVAGVINWAIRDYDTAAANQYGVFDLDNAEKAAQGSQMRALPRT